MDCIMSILTFDLLARILKFNPFVPKDYNKCEKVKNTTFIILYNIKNPTFINNKRIWTGTNTIFIKCLPFFILHICAHL